MRKLFLLLLVAITTTITYGQTLVQADSIWDEIKTETVKGANTATRVGTAGEYILSGIRDTLLNFTTTSDVNGLISDSLGLAVKLTGNQTISGTKTFTEIIKSDLIKSYSTNQSLIKQTNDSTIIYGYNETPIIISDDANVQMFDPLGAFLISTNGSTSWQYNGYNEEAIVQSTSVCNEFYGYGGSDFIQSDITSNKIYNNDENLAIELKDDSVLITHPISSNVIEYDSLINSNSSIFVKSNDLYLKNVKGSVVVGEDSVYINGPVGDLSMSVTDDSIFFYLPTNLPVAYGGIFVADASTSQSIPTGATYTKITAFTNAETSYNVTSVADSLTVLVDGMYEVTGSFSIASGTNDVNVYGAAFVNNVEQKNIHFERMLSDDVGSCFFTGHVYLSDGDDISFRMRTDDAGAVNITVHYANMGVKLLRQY